MVARERSGKRGAAIAEHEREGNPHYWSGVVCSPHGKASTERARAVGGVYRRSAATEVVYRPEHAARAPRISVTTIKVSPLRPSARRADRCHMLPRVSHQEMIKERVGSMSASDPSKSAYRLHDAMVSSILQPRPLPHGQGGVGHVLRVRLTCAYSVLKSHLRPNCTPYAAV